MKKFSTHLIFILLGLIVFGCTTSRQVSYRQALAIQNDRNYLTLLSGKKKYTLVNYQFTDLELTGTITEFKRSKGYPIQVFANLDYLPDLDKNLNNRIRIGSNNIEKITVKKRDSKKTTNSFLEFFGELFQALF